MDNLEREIKIISAQKQNQGKSEKELTSIAKENLERREILNSLAFCIDDKEKDFASTLLNKYLSESSLISTAEKDTLRQLVDCEILIGRIKEYLNTEYKKANPTIPIQLVQQLTELNKQIIELKEILGLSKREEQKNVLEEWNQLKEKALNYYKENAGCNVVKCPECKKTFMLLKDIRNYTAENIPMFKKTMLYNRKLFELYELGRITKEEISVILGVSPDYIDFIYENEYKNDK